MRDLFMGTSKNSYLRASALRIACLPRLVIILRCSQKMFPYKMFPYLLVIGCVNIFCSRLVLFRTLNF